MAYAKIFDETLALSSVGGDREFLVELVGLVQAAWPTLLSNIRKGMAQGDLRALAKTARLTKAAARNISARRVYERSMLLESLARKGDLPAAREAITSLEHEVADLQPYLAALERPV